MFLQLSEDGRRTLELLDRCCVTATTRALLVFQEYCSSTAASYGLLTPIGLTARHGAYPIMERRHDTQTYVHTQQHPSDNRARGPARRIFKERIMRGLAPTLPRCSNRTDAPWELVCDCVPGYLVRCWRRSNAPWDRWLADFCWVSSLSR